MASTPKSPLEHLQHLVQELPSLCRSLPTTIPCATKKDKIYEVVTNVKDGNDAWLTFNRRFDALFAEDCRDKSTGRLHYIRRGKFGMEAICTYLQSIDLTSTDLPLDLMVGKMTRLVEEIIYLM